MELLKEFISLNASGYPDYQCALEELYSFLKNSPAPLENIDLTPYRLASIFSKHIDDENSISLLIESLCFKHPVILIPKYYYEEDGVSVELTQKDVYLAISQHPFESPVSGREVTEPSEFIHVFYLLSCGAVEHG